jgi:hypothetical protein
MKMLKHLNKIEQNPKVSLTELIKAKDEKS